MGYRFIYLRWCGVYSGNMPRAEALVAKMEEGIKTTSKWAMFQTRTDRLALPNEEVRRMSSA